MDVGASPYPPLPQNISQPRLLNLSEVLSAIQAEISLENYFEESYLKESMINGALSTMFFGLFTVLTAVAVYVLCSKGIKREAVATMFIAIIVMWMSTVADWIGTLVAAAAAYTVLQTLTGQSLGWTSIVRECLYPGSNFGGTEGCQEQLVSVDVLLKNFKPYYIHDCLGTAALTVNVLIGDSIVWWRAWVLWPNSRVVRLGCIIMILLTTSTGIMNTRDACSVHAQVLHSGSEKFITTQPEIVGATSGIIFSGDVWGMAAGLCSLLTNTVATALIAYRAWEHRRIILSYLNSSSPRTQVERTLALLVESGVFYCALWLVIAVYEFSSLSPMLKGSAYQNNFYYIMEGCLVPIIGMYPTLVIILCAVDKSLHEKSQSADGDGARNESIVFAHEPANRPRGTLSELLSATSATTSEDVGLSSGERRQVRSGFSGGAIPGEAV
ncbi:hypothetical protein C8T65DRAFT_740370 [Cerioporus squamosus]|nr:hypothetical protein C8T65DRAFT_740370 [Cerioporus squamosus]